MIAKLSFLLLLASKVILKKKSVLIISISVVLSGEIDFFAGELISYFFKSNYFILIEQRRKVLLALRQIQVLAAI